jgi:hypothetical protein
MTARSQITNAAIEAGLKRTPQQRAEESEPAWRPIQDAPATPGTYINVRSVTTYRWLAYKPDGVRQMRKAGRWQIATEHGWEMNALVTVHRQQRRGLSRLHRRRRPLPRDRAEDRPEDPGPQVRPRSRAGRLHRHRPRLRRLLRWT